MCSTPLRWFADHQQWGCDRCQQLMPPPPMQVAPPTYYAPPRATAVAGTGSKRRVGLVVAIAGVAVAGGIVAIVLATRGKAGSTGSAGSVDAAIKRAFAEMSDGDAQSLISHAGMTTLKTYTDCDKDVDDDKEREELRDLEREMKRLARREKGTKFEVVGTTETKSDRKDKGTALGKHCTLKADLLIHTMSVELEVERAGTTYAQTATTTILEIDGNYFMVNAPKMPGCDAAVARAMLLADRGHSDRELDVATCIKEKWSQARIDCTAKALVMQDVDVCAGTSVEAAAAADRPASCKDYEAAIAKMDACATFPASYRKVFRDGFASEQQTPAWKGQRPEVRSALATSCATSATNITTIIAQYCP